MVLLILAILFAIASAIGYIRDRNDEAREKRWTSTLHPLFAAISFSFLALFALWCIFFTEDAVKRDHYSLKQDTWDKPDYVRIEGIPSVSEDKQENPKLPNAYRKRTTCHPLSLYKIPGDSIVWLKLRKQGRKGLRKAYRFAMATKMDTLVVEAYSNQVRFIKDKRPYIQMTRIWRINESLLSNRKPELDSVSYLISLPLDICWLEFDEKE